MNSSDYLTKSFDFYIKNNIKSIAYISEKSINPKYILTFLDDTCEYYTSEDDLVNRIQEIVIENQRKIREKKIIKLLQ